MGKKSTKTTSSSTPWAPAQPVLAAAGNEMLNTFYNNQGNLTNQEQLINHQLNPMWARANDTSTLGPGNSYNASVLGGKFLNSNPYTDAMTARAGQDAANAVNSTFSLAGRTGGGNHATDLARGVDQAENQVMFGNYQNERGLQNSTAGMLPSYQSAQFAGYQPTLQATQLAGQLPYYGSNSLGNVGGLYNGFGTQTGTQPGGWGTDLLNAGAAIGSAALMSDRRLKRDIVKVGEYPDGLGQYTFTYKFDPDRTVYRGVMADEVKQLRPWAYVANFRDGYDGVNYAKLQEAA